MMFIDSLLTTETIKVFCEKWKIVEFSLVGSVLRDDFGPDSDIDILVAHSKDAFWTLIDRSAMQHELEGYLHRKVDLIPKDAVLRSQNQGRKNAILSSSRILYRANA